MIFRHFVDGKGPVEVHGSRIDVTYPRRAHDPILRNVPLADLPARLPLPSGAGLSLRFQ